MRQHLRKNIWAIGLLLILPCFAHAAALSFVILPAQPAVNQDITVQVRLNTQADSINVADGAIHIPNGLQVLRVDTGGSAFSLWPTEPQLSLNTRNVNFTGGIAGGIAAKQDILLFTLTLSATTTGSYTLASQDVSIYRNDGSGTSVLLPASTKSIDVAQSGSASVASPRNIASPQFVFATVAQDPSLFGGKYYVSFAADDAQSSIAQYEIREGSVGNYVVADRYYVLRDQSLSSDIYVRASDTAGNATVIVIPAQHRPIAPLIIVAGILGILFVLRRRQKKSR